MTQNIVEVSLVEIDFLVDDICLSQISLGFTLDVRNPETPVKRAGFDSSVDSTYLHSQTFVFFDAHVDFEPTVDDDSHSISLSLL